MLQNALSQIEQGQTVRSKRTANREFFITKFISSPISASMVPQESITQNEGYSYGKGISNFNPPSSRPHRLIFH